MIKLSNILKQVLLEEKKKRDRCLRIADRKYDKPSAYKSGAVVKCRQGKIWKDLKEEEAKDTTKKFIVYPDFQGVDPANISGQNKIINVKDALGNEPNKDYNYFTTEKKDYVDKMIQSAQNDGWKSFEPVVAIQHPLLPGKYAVIDGNHRLGAFKLGKIPQIKATVLSYDDILLAVPGTKWQEGKTPETITLKDVKSKGIDLKKYFTTKDLQLKEDQIDEANKNTHNIVLTFDDERRISRVKTTPVFQKMLAPNQMNNLKVGDNKLTVNNVALNGLERMASTGLYTIKKDIDEAKKETLHTWFGRKGAPGKSKGWVDCNTCRDGKCKPCGRQEGESRSKYPSCRPTPAACKQKGKGTKWGKTK